MRMVGRAARESLAVDLADEGEAQLVAARHYRVVALVVIAAVLAEHALHLGVDFLLIDFDRGAIVGDCRKVHQRDGRQDFVADGESEVGLPVEHLVELSLVFGKIDLGLRRGALGTLSERLVDAGVDGVLHHLGHGGAAIDLLEMGERHLARAEALEHGLVLDLGELGIQPAGQILGRNGHGKLALQPIV